ncbi:MAG: ribose import ATP-binding protein RbsA 1 [Chthonomonas sp.]
MSRLLEATGIGKRFGGAIALEDVSLALHQGEIVGLIGENGAGKSTLIKIVSGIHRPDAGVIRLDGKPCAIPNVQAAWQHGIVLVHQELSVADNLGVSESMFLGRERRNRLGWIARREQRDLCAPILETLGVSFRAETPMATLSIGQRQLVEIARALLLESRLIILDEPTSSLTPSDAERLFAVLRQLRERGTTILYVSHRLPEIEALCDRVVGLRDGRNSGELVPPDISADQMIHLMVGRDLERPPIHETPPSGEVLLLAKGLRLRTNDPNGMNFEVRAGEVVGVGGLMGSGRTRLASTLFGLQRPVGGTLTICGSPGPSRSPRAAVRRGVALVPEDRKTQGLILDDTIHANCDLPVLPLVSKLGWPDRTRLRELAAKAMSTLGIKAPSARTMVSALSGGNQQKVAIGKWLGTGPRLLILDEPTRGVDVGAKSEIYRQIRQLADQGMAVVMVSSDTPELLSIPDRVLVMHQGRLAGELPRAHMDEERFLTLATGGAL